MIIKLFLNLRSKKPVLYALKASTWLAKRGKGAAFKATKGNELRNNTLN